MFLFLWLADDPKVSENIALSRYQYQIDSYINLLFESIDLFQKLKLHQSYSPDEKNAVQTVRS